MTQGGENPSRASKEKGKGKARDKKPPSKPSDPRRSGKDKGKPSERTDSGKTKSGKSKGTSQPQYQSSNTRAEPSDPFYTTDKGLPEPEVRHHSDHHNG